LNTKRRQFSAEEKVKILKRHLVGKEGISDICEEVGLNPNQFYRWQLEFFENGVAAFERRGKRENVKVRKLEDKIVSLESRLHHKDNVIAEITEDYVKLKKTLGKPKRLGRS